jgi:hypothetical protein
MRFNEFKPLVEYKARPQLPKNVRPPRTGKPVPSAPAAQAPADPFASMASNLTTQNQPAPTAPTQRATSTGGFAQPTVNPDGTTSTKHIANPNNPNITKPSLLNRMGNKLSSVLDFSKQGKIDSQAQKIFIDKFNKTMNYNIQSAQQQGMKFNLKGFVDGYMAKNQWKPGQFQQQLDHAVASNDRRIIPGIMAQIGKANTAMYSPTGEKEISGAFGDTPPPEAPPTAQEPTPAPEKLPMATVRVGGNPNKRNTLNPVDPVDAKILSMLKQQGKI